MLSARGHDFATMRILVVGFLFALLIKCVVGGNEARPLTIRVDRDTAGYRDDQVPLVSGLSYNVTCGTVDGSKLVYNTSIGVLDRETGEETKLGVAERNTSTITSELQSSVLTSKSKWSEVHLRCTSSETNGSGSRTTESLYKVCPPLQTLVIRIKQIVGHGNNFWEISVTPSQSSQVKWLNFFTQATVTRNWTFYVTYPNGNSVSIPTSSNNCSPSFGDKYDYYQCYALLEPRLTFTAVVTDVHYVDGKPNSPSLQSSSNQTTVQLIDNIQLTPLDIFQCNRSIDSPGDLIFKWKDNQLSMGAIRQKVQASIDCDCARLSAFSAPIAAGHYKGFVANVSVSTVSTTVKVPTGAICNCSMTRRLGKSEYVSEAQYVTCESTDDYAAVQAVAIFDTVKVHANKTVCVGVHVVWPTAEELAGVATEMKLTVRTIATANESSVKYVMERIVQTNSSYVELTPLDDNQKYRIRMEVATRVGYKPATSSSSTMDGQELKVMSAKYDKNEKDNGVAGIWCGNAVSVNRQKNVLEYHVRCFNKKASNSYVYSSGSDSDSGEGVDVSGSKSDSDEKGIEEASGRLRIVLTGVACVGKVISGVVQECEASKLLYTSVTVSNGRLEELNSEVLSLRGVSESVVVESMLVGESVSVSDETSGQVLYWTGIRKPSCVYYSDGRAVAPEIEVHDGWAGKAPKVVLKVRSCKSLWREKVAVIDQVQLRVCSVGNESKQCSERVLRVPLAGVEDSSVKISLEETEVDKQYEVEYGWKSVNGTWEWNNVKLKLSRNSVYVPVWAIILGIVFVVSIPVLSLSVVVKRRQSQFNKNISSGEEVGQSSGGGHYSGHSSSSGERMFTNVQTDVSEDNDGDKDSQHLQSKLSDERASGSSSVPLLQFEMNTAARFASK